MKCLTINPPHILPYLLVLTLFFPTQVAAFSAASYGSWFSGDGTYYGETEGGHCSLTLPRPPMYKDMVPVALNTAQYGDSLPCGACIRFVGTGQGSGANPIVGTKMGYIMDSCPSCASGDIDLAKSGDGRWHVRWEFVRCPGNGVFFQFQGSHEWYKKIQARGTKTPVKTLKINGHSGYRVIDNFFEIHGYMVPPLTVTMETVDGEHVTATLTYMEGTGTVYPASSSSNGGGGGGNSGGGGGGSGGGGNGGGGNGGSGRPSTGGRGSRPRPPSGGNRCVRNWMRCRRGNSSQCCGNSRCVRARTRRFNGYRCEPRRKSSSQGRCVPRWRACSGSRNRWGTSRCCGDYVCERPMRNLGYKICRPRRKMRRKSKRGGRRG